MLLLLLQRMRGKYERNHIIVALNLVMTDVNPNLPCYRRISQLSMKSNILKHYSTSVNAVRKPMKQKYEKN